MRLRNRKGLNMARRRRLSYAGIPQHLIQRGNNRQVCFADEQDMLTFGQWLCDYSNDYSVAVHSRGFMTNHIHLLATPTGPDSIGLMMQALGRRYFRYFQNRHRRTGTLWEGRYRSCQLAAPLACYPVVDRGHGARPVGACIAESGC